MFWRILPPNPLKSRPRGLAITILSPLPLERPPIIELIWLKPLALWRDQACRLASVFQGMPRHPPDIPYCAFRGCFTASAGSLAWFFSQKAPLRPREAPISGMLIYLKATLNVQNHRTRECFGVPSWQNGRTSAPKATPDRSSIIPLGFTRMTSRHLPSGSQKNRS